MKRLNRLLMLFGLLTVFVGVSYATGPLETNQLGGPYYDTQVIGSTWSVSGATNVTLPALAARNGVGALTGITNGRYCFTNVEADLTAGTTGYIVDNSTNPTATSYMFYPKGVTVGAVLNTPGKEPLCLGYGDSANLVIAGSGPFGMTWTGYTTYGKAGGSQVNAGK